MVCMRCEHPLQEGAHYCPHCGAPVEQTRVPDWRREQAERLLREAMSLNEQGRTEEALLACEGALALDPEWLPALSLKALLHERRGQIEQAIETYQRVVQLNPLSISERARLEALRRQPRAVGQASRGGTRPLWMEALPVILAFIGAGMVLLVGLVAILRLSAPVSAPTASPPAAASAETASPSMQPATPPAHAPNQPPQQAVPPVMVDPSRLALAPMPETTAPPRGAIPPLAAPSLEKRDSQTAPNGTSPRAKNEPPRTEQDEVLPDVEVREDTQRGVYRIEVHRNETPSNQSTGQPREDPLEVARRHQMAGNYREAIAAYEQALPTASSPGTVHQQIAICYLRLGEKVNARTHFQQAIQAYQEQIQRGQQVEAAREGIRACEQGLKLCE
jgi:tetratricopeptide (TPR) repeat protein